MAESYGKVGQSSRGLTLIAEAAQLAEETGESWADPEIQRDKGELLLLRAEDDRAERAFRRAIEIAGGQGGKAFELRAATSLSRLWQRQGKTGEAGKLLSETYGWFTEGFDTADLKAAKALLEELG